MVLLDEAIPMIADKGITLIGVAVSNLDRDGAEQLELPFDGPGFAGPDTAALDSAMDSVRKKFGSAALTRECSWDAIRTCRCRYCRTR